MHVLKGFGLGKVVDQGGADPGDTAMAIIRGGALRQREVYFPYFSAKIVTLLRDTAPQALEALHRVINGKPIF